MSHRHLNAACTAGDAHTLTRILLGQGNRAGRCSWWAVVTCHSHPRITHTRTHAQAPTATVPTHASQVEHCARCVSQSSVAMHCWGRAPWLARHVWLSAESQNLVDQGTRDVVGAPAPGTKADTHTTGMHTQHTCTQANAAWLTAKPYPQHSVARQASHELASSHGRRMVPEQVQSVSGRHTSLAPQ